MAVNPAFILHTYNDELYARRLIRQIRSLYPASWIGLIADGTRPLGFEYFAECLDVEYQKGDRLKLAHLAPLWTKRWMLAAWGKGEPIIKLDADSWLWRRFRSCPDSDLAGTVVGYCNQRIHIVRGGCVAYKQRAIDKILDSGRLDLPCYKDPLFYAYYRFDEFKFPGEVRSGELIYSEDCAIGHIAKVLNLSLTNWSECLINFREAVPDNSALQWAATHPHRL